MNWIQIPQGWDDRARLAFEKCRGQTNAAQHTVRCRHRRCGGPPRGRHEGSGRLDIKVADARRSFASATSKATPKGDA